LLMVSILIALSRGLFVWVGSWEIKKGPKRPRAHRLNLDGVQPSPAMRLGTTTISSFVIILRMRPTKLPKGCANHSGRGPKVKGNGQEGYDFATLAGQAALGECEFAAVAQNDLQWGGVARMSVATSGLFMAAPGCRCAHPGYRLLPSSHPLAASGFTHSNSGN